MSRSASRLSGSVASLLGRVDSISPLLHQAERLRLLQQELDHSGPPALTRGCRVVSVRQGTVVIQASNNAIAAKLKLLAPMLLDRLHASGSDVKAVKVEVQFLTPPLAGTGATKKIVVSPPARPLDELAARLPDSRLRDAIASLARKGRR